MSNAPEREIANQTGIVVEHAPQEDCERREDNTNIDDAIDSSGIILKNEKKHEYNY
jgi:hypothetical protein